MPMVVGGLVAYHFQTEDEDSNLRAISCRSDLKKFRFFNEVCCYKMMFHKLLILGMLSSSCTLDENGDDSPTREDNAPDVIIEDDDEDESMRFKPSDTEIEPLADVQKVSFENESLKQFVNCFRIALASYLKC